MNYIPSIPTQEDLEKSAEKKMVHGNTGSTVGKVVPIERALLDNDVRLSKAMKLRMNHKGFISNDIACEEEWLIGAGTGEIQNAEGESVSIEGHTIRSTSRNLKENPYAKLGDQMKITKHGTFTIEEVYVDEYFGTGESSGERLHRTDEIAQNVVFNEGSGESDLDNNEIINAIDSLYVDNQQKHDMKIHYRRGEVEFDPIAYDNFLDRPGIEVNTDDTYLGPIEFPSGEESGESSGESTGETM